MSFGLLRRVVRQRFIDVSEVAFASIIRTMFTRSTRLYSAITQKTAIFIFYIPLLDSRHLAFSITSRQLGSSAFTQPASCLKILTKYCNAIRLMFSFSLDRDRLSVVPSSSSADFDITCSSYGQLLNDFHSQNLAANLAPILKNQVHKNVEKRHVAGGTCSCCPY